MGSLVLYLNSWIQDEFIVHLKLNETMTPKFTPLKDHDTPIKVLFTGYLCTVGIGYFFALIQILFTHGMADGKFGLSVDDIVYSYYGNRSGTVLEKSAKWRHESECAGSGTFQDYGVGQRRRG